MKNLVSALMLLGLTHSQQAFAQSIDLVPAGDDRLLVPLAENDEVKVVDGDTLWLGIFQVRLFGIDALEATQPCEFEGEPKTYCHLRASQFLRQFADRDDFRCEVHVRDGENKPWMSHSRYVATCYAGGVEVNREMVRQGWAYAAHTSYGDEYRSDQQVAARAARGIHSTLHQEPIAWRRGQRDDDCTC